MECLLFEMLMVDFFQWKSRNAFIVDIVPDYLHLDVDVERGDGWETPPHMPAGRLPPYAGWETSPHMPAGRICTRSHQHVRSTMYNYNLKAILHSLTLYSVYGRLLLMSD